MLVQDSTSCEYDGMPRSAIATGLVDFILSPVEMPAQLIAYRQRAFGKPITQHIIARPGSESLLKKIFVLLRKQTGHDFSQYKMSTINRRLERRLAVRKIEVLDEYVRVLQQDPMEVEKLYRDLLIGVTGFFRDTQAFQYLELQIIPKLFEGKLEDSSIRVWSVGCSTGEEVYSLAILLTEYQQAHEQSFRVQIFATDIDNQAIATARSGIYPINIATELSSDRLHRFFDVSMDGSSYRVRKEIRDMVVFSEQDVVKDPPFSRLDLISCRNLLIYLDGDLQKKIISTFHYALRQEGILFLGSSESVGNYIDVLFAVLDRKAKIFTRKDDLPDTLRAHLTQNYLPKREEGRSIALPERRKNLSVPAQRQYQLSLREITEQALLQHLTLAAALVNGQGDVLYFHGHTGLFLEPAHGEARGNNILRMAREGLRYELTAALFKAQHTNALVHSPGLRIKTNGDYTQANLTVRPIPGINTTQLFLVILEELPALALEISAVGAAVQQGEKETQVVALKQELRIKGEYLQAANEELATSNEELKSSNEEMQSVNEELQSINEELETSKEELQAVNEELSTVNAEQQNRLSDLTQVNNDMNNLLAGTDIATIFVDHDLRLLRFTPTATVIINLIPGDVGRPVGQIVSNLVRYENLLSDIKTVLDTLQPKDLEVQTIDQRWFTLRIRPYRTIQNVIEGAVITFVDITTRKHAEAALWSNEKLYRSLLDTSPDAILYFSMDMHVLFCNQRAAEMYAVENPAAMLGISARDLFVSEDNPWMMAELSKLPMNWVLRRHESGMRRKDGSAFVVEIAASLVIDEKNEVVGIISIVRDITPREVGVAA